MNFSFQNDRNFLSGTGEMASLVREKNWSTTPLGPIEGWPQSLRTAVSLCLASNFPINIIWGEQNTQIYNDGYRVVCGDAHPAALGQNYGVTWASAWPAIGEPFNRAREGATSYLENQRMFLTRNGYLEETFFTFSTSPIRDESGGIGGLFHPVTETTASMLSERRTRALRDLTTDLAAAESVPDLLGRVKEKLSRFAFDLPFMLFYGLDETTGNYRLRDGFGIALDAAISPAELRADSTAPWPIQKAVQTLRPVRVEHLSKRLRGAACGPYEEPPDDAFLLPVGSGGNAGAPALLVIAGASSRLPLDEVYRAFYELLTTSLSGALATVLARENERRRAEALAEIDRAKTTFFSNVSHEFRTPLTLLLSPLEELSRTETLPEEQRVKAELAHRNGLRLLRLVNSLLDFSRVEAGRAQAHYEPVELAGYTAELASTFRSATERAGLALTVEPAVLKQPVYLDRGMWETVVLNLLSNAFKFTLEGEIRVRIREAADGGGAEVSVADTGTGIPPDALPKLFERFYRVEGAEGRSFEGSGIGLSLVRELVNLHGGVVLVDSEPGKGTTFTVRLPYGVAHLPPDALQEPTAAAGPSTRSEAFVSEALRWLPDRSHADATEPEAVAPIGRVLLADDNADMRAYVKRLLESAGYDVEAVSNGIEALQRARARTPDLFVSDVMMPRLDGFGLLHAVRADESLQEVPFIMLSARAGEEARVEGIEAGADDYLVKPFSARELTVRVSSALALVRDRRQQAALAAQVRIDELAADVDRRAIALSHDFGKTWEVNPELMCVVGAEGFFESCNPAWQTVLGWSQDELMQSRFSDLLHPDDLSRTLAAWENLKVGHAVLNAENRYRRKDGAYRWLSWVAVPEEGKFYCSARDTTEDKQRASELAAAQESLRHSQKMEAVGQLTGGVAHDFNNLLTVIRGSVDLLRRSGLPEDKRVRSIDAISSTVDSGAKLTAQLLAFARRQTLKPELFDVRSGIAAVGEMLRALVGSQVVLDFPSSNVESVINADAGQFDTALVNLVANAKDAMPQGGTVTISIEVVDGIPALREQTARTGEFVAVHVADTGVGIAEDLLEKIFEPFFTTKGVGKGTGLGLSQVFGFVKQSGGEVQVRSSPGAGATFSLFLPRVPAPRPANPTTNANGSAQAAGDGVKVLVVEDNEDIGEFTSMALEQMGFEVVLAKQGVAALAELAKDGSRFDVVFSDVMMPLMGGIELGHAIRKSRPGLPVILTSGYSNVMADTGTQGFELVTKPYSIDDVVARLLKAVRQDAAH
jgi:PAS domain S-box-containing protein